MAAFLHGLALRYFVEVARTGSISDASARLHVAVSAISRQIAKLENETGAPLFERRPRGMALSEPASGCWRSRSAACWRPST